MAGSKRVSRKTARLVTELISDWVRAGLISSDQAERLADSYEAAGFNWQAAAKYSVWFAVSCAVISVVALLADDALLALLERLFDAPDIAKCIVLALVAAEFFVFASRRRRRGTVRPYTTEGLYLAGVLATAGAIAFLGRAVDTGSGHFSVLVLLAAVIYMVLGALLPSTLVWVFGLLSLGGWMGAETGYISGWGAYFLGMNYPLRFALFGLALIETAHLALRRSRYASLFGPTLNVGMLYLFVALWLMSIFGNYGSLEVWRQAGPVELLPWALLFGLAAVGAIVYGLRYETRAAIGFGLTFLFINLYTRFFEHFWNGTHKAVFFGVLAVTFWVIARRAETIWSFAVDSDLSQRIRPDEAGSVSGTGVSAP